MLCLPPQPLPPLPPPESLEIILANVNLVRRFMQFEVSYQSLYDSFLRDSFGAGLRGAYRSTTRESCMFLPRRLDKIATWKVTCFTDGYCIGYSIGLVVYSKDETADTVRSALLRMRSIVQSVYGETKGVQWYGDLRVMALDRKKECSTRYISFISAWRNTRTSQLGR